MLFRFLRAGLHPPFGTVSDGNREKSESGESTSPNFRLRWHQNDYASRIGECLRVRVAMPLTNVAKGNYTASHEGTDTPPRFLGHSTLNPTEYCELCDPDPKSRLPAQVHFHHIKYRSYLRYTRRYTGFLK